MPGCEVSALVRNEVVIPWCEVPLRVGDAWLGIHDRKRNHPASETF